MKFCPFLVAGQSLVPQQQVGASSPTPAAAGAPDVDTILHDDSVQPAAAGTTADGTVDASTETQVPSTDPPGPTDGSASTEPGHDPQELQIVRFRTISGSLRGAPTLPARPAQLSALECLGEPCRFFHAGGCRFDALFESQVRNSSARGGAVLGTIVDVPQDAVVEVEDGDGASRTLAARSVLEEVWSLQRESLREVMGGFHKLEAGGERLQSGITQQVDASVTRLHEGLGQVGTQVGGVTEQVEHVATQVGKVHSQVSDALSHLVQVAASVGQVGSSVGKVEGRVGEVGTQISSVVERVSDTQSRVEHATSVVAEIGTVVGQVGSQIEQVGGRVGAVENRTGRIEGRMERLESQLTTVGSQLTAMAAAVATVESHVKQIESKASNTQSSVAIVVSEMQDLRTELGTLVSQIRTDSKAGAGSEQMEILGRQVDLLTRDLRQLEGGLRATVGESMRAMVKEAQVASQQAIAASEVGLRSAIENLQSVLRATMAESKDSLRSSVSESHSQLGSLLSRATAETRAQLERGLAKMLEEMNAVRDARVQIQAALDGLTRETREVGALARRLESSQVLTHELLDEQRQVHAKVSERERREQAKHLNNAGVLSYHNGAYDASVERFREATELDPSLAEAFNNLGLSYTEMGRDDEATIAFQRALELDPAAAHVYNNLGYLYYRRGQLDHAVEMYERAIQRGADSSAAYSNLANAFYRLKQTDRAVEAWRRALEIDPANAKAAAALERLGLEPHRDPRRA